jgi:carboxylate-amine ligase
MDWPYNTAFGTIGIEEEFQLLSPVDHQLMPSAPTLLRHADSSCRLHPELFQCMVEQVSPVLGSLDHLEEYIQVSRSSLANLADRYELVVASAGTHPLADPYTQLITDHPRYLGVRAQYGLRAQRELIFGLHIHVGVPDKEQATRVANYLRQYIPVLIALGASSPYWRGLDTGCAALRPLIFTQLPRTGIPPYWEEWDHYVEWIAKAKGNGTIPDASYTWWDVRLHPKYGTVEVRCVDAQPSAIDTQAMVDIVLNLANSCPDSKVSKSPDIESKRLLACRQGVRAYQDEIRDLLTLPLRGGTKTWIKKILDNDHPSTMRQHGPQGSLTWAVNRFKNTPVQ